MCTASHEASGLQTSRAFEEVFNETVWMGDVLGLVAVD